MTHLNNVGFRPYAINLVRHLEREIYGEKLFEHYISLPYLDRQIYIREVKNAPLKSLVGNKHCYQTWRIYGEFGIDKFQQNVLENNCFMTLDEMKQSIHFF